MRKFKVLGAIFCVFGCIFALVGILSSILPMIQNDQFQLIVESLQKPSADSLTNTLNSIVVFCLHSGYFFFFCGISLTVAGGLISSSARRLLKASAPSVPEISIEKKPAADSGIPKPAYYPGGLTPPAISLVPEKEEPAYQIVSTFQQKKAAPIAGGVEPALNTDESDAQRLMRNDELMQAQTQWQRPPAPPDYSQYPSNSEPSNPQAEDGQMPHSPQEQHRPKIVSTMGKNRR